MGNTCKCVKSVLHIKLIYRSAGIFNKFPIVSIVRWRKQLSALSILSGVTRLYDKTSKSYFFRGWVEDDTPSTPVGGNLTSQQQLTAIHLSINYLLMSDNNSTIGRIKIIMTIFILLLCSNLFEISAVGLWPSCLDILQAQDSNGETLALSPTIQHFKDLGDKGCNPDKMRLKNLLYQGMLGHNVSVGMQMWNSIWHLVYIAFQTRA